MAGRARPLSEAQRDVLDALRVTSRAEAAAGATSFEIARITLCRLQSKNNARRSPFQRHG